MSVKMLSVFQEPAREEFKNWLLIFSSASTMLRVFSHSKGFGAMQT